MSSSKHGQPEHSCSGGLDKFPDGNDLYKSLRKYIMSKTSLVKNGFPRPHPNGDPGRAVAKSVQTFIHDEARRSCSRCNNVYAVRPDGTPAIKESCTHHAGRRNARKVGTSLQSCYSCCGGGKDAPPCTTLDFHIPKLPPVSWIHGFVTCVQEAGDNNLMGKSEWDIVAIDCEMVTTIEGSELARATFVGIDQKVIYDELVLSRNPILDYRTNFSGLTAEIMKKATATLSDVQAAMMAGLKPNSIIIGHSLEFDLTVLRFKHYYVIDTSVLFPHHLGLPVKHRLSTLVSKHLEKTIQDSEAGHDSVEDARVALDLVNFKLSQDNTPKVTLKKPNAKRGKKKH